MRLPVQLQTRCRRRRAVDRVMTSAGRDHRLDARFLARPRRAVLEVLGCADESSPRHAAPRSVHVAHDAAAKQRVGDAHLVMPDADEVAVDQSLEVDARGGRLQHAHCGVEVLGAQRRVRRCQQLEGSAALRIADGFHARRQLRANTLG